MQRSGQFDRSRETEFAIYERIDTEYATDLALRQFN